MPQARHHAKWSSRVNSKPLARPGLQADDNAALVRVKAPRADALLGFVFGPARDRRDFDGVSRRKPLMLKNERNGLSSLRSRRA
jgi:hypothetical protein